jgi:hypothetical protein
MSFLDWGERQGRKRSARSVNKAKPYPLAAPVGGINARDSLAAMQETDAIILDNFFAQPTWVEFRKGETTLASFTGNAETLMGYMGSLGVANQLFAAINNAGTRGIYRVDNAGGGSPGTAVVGGGTNIIQAVTSTVYDYNQFGSGSGEFLWCLNASGADLPLLFDGTTWNAVDVAGGTYQLTGGPSGGTTAGLKTLSQVAVYKQRLWFLQQGTFQVWYLPQLQAAGALTNLNIGADFKLGGYCAAMITISSDSAMGMTDYMAFVSTMGEVVVYQGYDPTFSSTWSIAAHFVMGRLMNSGRKAWTKVGTDALMLTIDGAQLLSQAMLTDRSQTRQAVTDKIRFGLATQMQVFPTAQGWQVQLYPFGNKLLIQNPTANLFSTSFLWVQNTLSGAWSTFGQLNSSWNTFCLEMWGDNLYGGQGSTVSQIDVGNSDAGNAVTFSVKPAYSQQGSPGQLKRWTQFQPIFQVSGQLKLAITLSVDFDSSVPTGAIPISSGSSATWNVSLWTTPTYWQDVALIAKPWIGLAGAGYWGTIYMRASGANLSAKWMGSNWLAETGGVFYGTA